MSDWFDEQNYSNILTKLSEQDLSFCSRFKECKGFDRGFFGSIDDKYIFAKLSKSEHDNSLNDEYKNGLIINSVRNEIPNFLYTYSLTRVKQCHFPTGKYKFPRDVLFTEYVNEKLLYMYIKNTDFIKLLSWYQQIVVVLNFTFKKIGFQHGDCHILNIVIKSCESPVAIQYDDITIHVDEICVIYDFGRSTFCDDKINNGPVNDLKTCCKSMFGKKYNEEMKIMLDHLDNWDNVSNFLDFCYNKWNCDIRIGENKKINLVYTNCINDEVKNQFEKNIDISHIGKKQKKKPIDVKVEVNNDYLINKKNYIAPIAPWVNVEKVKSVSISELLNGNLSM